MSLLEPSRFGRDFRWRPATVCAAVSLAFSKYAQAQAPSEPKPATQWEPNVEVFAAPGTRRSYIGTDAVVPIVQDGRSLLFGDFKFNKGQSESQEFNLGAAYRRYLDERNDWAYGFYAGWDRRRSEDTDNKFNQVTLGAELRSAVWDFRGNYYAPLTSKKFTGSGSSQFAGFGVFRNSTFEEAMHGFDLQVGARLPVDLQGMELRGYLTGYTFKGADIAPRTNGVRASLEFTPRQDWTIGASVQHDSLFGTAAFLQVRYSFTKPPITAEKTLRDRMTDPWVRDIDVAVSPIIETSNPKYWRTVQTTGAVHVDSSKPAGGDGSFEKPYDSIAACVSALCNDSSTSMIRLWQGNSTAAAPYANGTTFNLLAGQTLWGQGVDIFSGKTSSHVPVIGSAGATGNAIKLADNTTVAGVNARGQIYGYNLQGSILLRNNTITAVGTSGVNMYSSGAGLSSSITLANNTITSDQVIAVGIGQLVASGAGSQAITLTGNTIVSTSSASSSGPFGKYGAVALRNLAVAGGYAQQSITMTGNKIASLGTGGKYSAVSLSNASQDPGSVAIQSATLSGNTINAGGTAVAAFNFGYASTATQNVTLSGNTISSLGNAGIGVVSMINVAYGGIATQNATLSGNSIVVSGTGKYIFALGFGFNGGSATQNLALSGNTVTGPGGSGFGLGLYAVSGYGPGGPGATVTQNATLSGNTITAGTGTAFGIFSAAGAGNTATQSVVLTGDTLVAPGGTGVFMGNSGYASQSVLLKGVSINAATPVANTGSGTCTGGGVAGCP